MQKWWKIWRVKTCDRQKDATVGGAHLTRSLSPETSMVYHSEWKQWPLTTNEVWKVLFAIRSTSSPLDMLPCKRVHVPRCWASISQLTLDSMLAFLQGLFSGLCCSLSSAVLWPTSLQTIEYSTISVLMKPSSVLPCTPTTLPLQCTSVLNLSKSKAMIVRI